MNVAAAVVVVVVVAAAVAAMVVENRDQIRHLVVEEGRARWC